MNDGQGTAEAGPCPRKKNQHNICWRKIIFFTLCDTLYTVIINNNYLVLWSRWCNGLAYLQQWLCYLKGPGLSPIYNQWSFSPVTRFLHSTIKPLNVNICAMRLNKGRQGHRHTNMSGTAKLKFCSTRTQNSFNSSLIGIAPTKTDN